MSGPADPGLLRSIDPGSRVCDFLRVDRATLSRTAFHDHRLGTRGSLRVSAADAAVLAASTSQPRVNYIFHTAFCGSTLLARCLDIPGSILSIREPEVLMELANHKRMKRFGMGVAGNRHEILDLSARLLGASGDVEEKVVIKPTNAVNNLAVDMLALSSTHAILLMYSDLKSFLISVIKKGEPCRAYVRQLFNVINLDTALFGHINERQRLLFTDLQIAAIVWYLQMRNYMHVIENDREGRVRTLDSARFFSDPADVLPRIAEFFNLAVDRQQLDAVLTSGVFERDSKDPEQTYDTRLRDEESAQIEATHGAALETIVGWARSLQDQMQLTIPAILPSSIDEPA